MYIHIYAIDARPCRGLASLYVLEGPGPPSFSKKEREKRRERGEKGGEEEKRIDVEGAYGFAKGPRIDFSVCTGIVCSVVLWSTLGVNPA